MDKTPMEPKMKHFAIRLVTLLFILTLPCSAFAAIYKWVDANGVVTFKDTPPPVGVKSEVVNTSSSVPVGSETSNNSGTAPVATIKEHKVEIYTTDWCPYCKQAVNFLKANNIPFTEYDIEKDPGALRRKNQLDSQPGVPFVIIDGKEIHGYNLNVYKEALGMK